LELSAETAVDGPIEHGENRGCVAHTESTGLSRLCERTVEYSELAREVSSALVGSVGTQFQFSQTEAASALLQHVPVSEADELAGPRATRQLETQVRTDSGGLA